MIAGFGLEQTADCFDLLMKQLGYGEYLSHGSGSGFAICRMLSLRHSRSCVAVHTISPQIPPPMLRQAYAAATRYQVARLTGARYERLAFGYIPSEVTVAAQNLRKGGASQSFGTYDGNNVRPQTRAFSLTDSPAGLLAYVIDLLRPPALDIPQKPPPLQQRAPRTASASSSRSSSADNVRRAATDPFMEPIRESVESGLSLSQLMQPSGPAWTPNDVLDWTMMMWLPGPEGGLQWQAQVNDQHATLAAGELWTGYSHVPLGISTFKYPNDQAASGGGNESNGIVRAAPKNQGPSSVPPDTTEASTWDFSRLFKHWAKIWRTSSSKQRTEHSASWGSSSPPSWASAYQPLEWLRRHEIMVRLPIWEASDQVVVDIRECFGTMLDRELIHLPYTS